VLAAVFPGSSSGQSRSNIATIAKDAFSACGKLKGDNAQVCNSAVVRLVESFNLQDKGYSYFTKTAARETKALNELSRNASKSCDQGNKTACQQYRATRARLEAIEQAIKRAESHKKKSVDQEFGRTARSIPTTLQGYTGSYRVFCKQTPQGHVKCVRLENLLAGLKSEMVIALIKDLDQLNKRLKNDSTKCADGRWASLSTESDLGGYEKLGRSAKLQVDLSAAISNKCLTAGTSVSDESGLSGITGLGSMSSVCALSLQPSKGLSDLVSQFQKIDAAFNQSCNTTLAGSLMEGTESDKAQQKITDNGDGTETVCDDAGDNCYVRYKKEAGGDTTTGGKNPTETCDSSGVCTSEVSGLDYNNRPYTVKVTRYPDGTEFGHIHWPDFNGAPLDKYIIDTPGGTDYMMICRGSSCRDGYLRPGQREPTMFDEGNPAGWDKRWNGIANRKVTGDCFEDSCPSCQQHHNDLSKIKFDCLSSGGNSPTCQASLQASSCCSDSRLFPPSGKLIIPRQDGGYGCNGNASAEIASGVCKKKCSIASDADCTTACSSSANRGRMDFDMLDAFCKRAISDSCFGSGAAASRAGSAVPLTADFMSEKLLFERFEVPQ
jgi:hypothetical protein